MSIALQVLLNSVAVAGVGATFDLSTNERYQGGAHTFEVGNAFVGTVAVEGRIDTNWYSLGSLTAPGLIYVDGVFNALRGNVTAYTSGTIDLAVSYGLLQNLNGNLLTLLARLTDERAGNLDFIDALISAIDPSVDLRRVKKLIQQTL